MLSLRYRPSLSACLHSPAAAPCPGRFSQIAQDLMPSANLQMMVTRVACTSRLLTKTRNKMGPNTNPCGTTDNTLFQFDDFPNYDNTLLPVGQPTLDPFQHLFRHAAMLLAWQADFCVALCRRPSQSRGIQCPCSHHYQLCWLPSLWFRGGWLGRTSSSWNFTDWNCRCHCRGET